MKFCCCSVKPSFPRASERRVLLWSLWNIFSSSHPHMFTSSHPHIFTSSHLHILSSSHVHILTTSHLHISSHLLIFTSSHLHICSSSHLLLLTSSHLHIFTSSHPHILPSCSLALLLSPSFLFLSWRRGAVPTRWQETQPFRTKWISIAKTAGKIASCDASGATPSHEMRFDRQKLQVKLRVATRPANPFARNERFDRQKTAGKVAISGFMSQPLNEMMFDRKKLQVKLRFHGSGLCA